MKKTISLNGQWAMYMCPIGAGSLENYQSFAMLPYQVPGDVHTPLIESGRISEPVEGMNSLQCRWVEEQEFWCERIFALTEEELASKMLLTFDGLDCTARVYLNGTLVGVHNNAFVEISWDVARLLKTGENRLLVCIDQGLEEAKAHPLEKMDMMWNNDQPWRAWMRKPQYVYGWDWTIWLASCGIWKDVSLTAVRHAAVLDVYPAVGQQELTEGESCLVDVAYEVMTLDGFKGMLSCTIMDRDGDVVASEQSSLVSGISRLTIPTAHLWWCNGMGEPYLYTVTVKAFDADGRLIDSRTQRFGLRTIRLIQPDMGDEGSGFTFVLNGEKVFCKGANHVPCDCLPGRITADKETRLMRMAWEENMNMLRIWGGGTYASEALMDACDELGILVWHDFMFACGYHPDHDPGFMENVRTEARKAIRRLRRHTSLIGWAGNNEIQEMYLSQKKWNPDLPWYGGRIYEQLLPELVAELCPALVYQPSSPFGGEYQADGRKGDQHIWLLTHVDSHPHYLDLWWFTDFQVKFLSEFGLMGAMTLETARSCIPAEHMDPADPVWLHHTNSCQEHTLLDRMMRQYFGEGEHSPQQYILRSQAIQAEITRHIYEEYRRKKFYCSGLLFWTLSDSYGVHNWSLIDYGLRRKPIYFALKQAMAPVALCIRGWDLQTQQGKAQWQEHWKHEPGFLEIWGMNDTRVQAQCSMSWDLMTLDGKCIQSGSQAVSIPVNASVPLSQISLEGICFDPKSTVFRARLMQDGQMLNESKYFFAPFAQMIPETANVDLLTRKTGQGRYEVTLTADSFLWMAHLAEPDGTAYSDNDFDLWPGESRTVSVVSDDPDYVPKLTWMGKEHE